MENNKLKKIIITEQQLKGLIQNLINENGNNSDLDEGISRVSGDVTERLKTIYEIISKNLDKLKQLVANNETDSHLLNFFKNIIPINDLKGNRKFISLNFVDNPKTGTKATYWNNHVITFNLAYFDTYGDFEEIMEHELIHGMDPKIHNLFLRCGNDNVIKKCCDDLKKTMDMAAFRNCFLKVKDEMNKKNDKSRSEKYHNEGVEFDAFAGSMIKTIKQNITAYEDLHKEIPDIKNRTRNYLLKMLSDIKTLDHIEVYDNYYNTFIPYLFTRNSVSGDANQSTMYRNYNNAISIFKSWSKKPTHYNRFLKYLGTELNK